MASLTKTLKDREWAEVQSHEFYPGDVTLHLQPDYGQSYYENLTAKQARKLGKALVEAADKAEEFKRKAKKAAKKEGK